MRSCTAGDIARAKEAGTITTPLDPDLAGKVVQPLLLAAELNQEALHETCLGIVHKLVRARDGSCHAATMPPTPERRCSNDAQGC